MNVRSLIAWWVRPGPWGVPRGMWALAALAVLARLAAIALLIDPDTEWYREFGPYAEHLLAGDGYVYAHVDGRPVPSAYMPPGYVAYLIPPFALFEGTARLYAVLAGQALVGGLTVVLAFEVARRWYGVRAGWAAAALAGFVPALVAAAATVSPAVFVHAGVLATLAIMTPRPETKARAVGLGVMLAGLVLFRSEMALVAVLFLGLLAWERRWTTVALAGLTLAVGVGPWVVRNAVVLGEPVLSTSMGFNLLRGHNDQFVGSWTDAEAASRVAALPLDASFEIEMNRIYTERAMEHMRDDPGRSLLGAVVKVSRLWLLDLNDPRARHPLYIGSVLLLLGLAIGGIWRSRPPPELWLFFAAVTVSAAVFFAFARHQVFLMAALLPPAACGASALWSRLTRHAQRA